jgi:hypothetical protein
VNGHSRPAAQPRFGAATAKAWLDFGHQTAEQIGWLGGRAQGNSCLLTVLDQELVVDPASARVTLATGQDVRPEWQILVLHYLAVSGRPEPRPPEVTFADLPNGRGYADVYDKRVLKRLCATAGREAAALRRAAEGLQGREVPGGDAAFQFTVFPRVPIRLIWHAPDEEFPPSASILLPANVEEFFSTEDIVVLCECCVSRLSGRPF